MADADNKLTPEQVANWKRAFPEFTFCTDKMIQRLRDEMQRRIDADGVEANQTPKTQESTPHVSKLSRN